MKLEPIEMVARSICAALYSDEAMPQIWPTRLSQPDVATSQFPYYQPHVRVGHLPATQLTMGTCSFGAKNLRVKYIAPFTEKSTHGKQQHGGGERSHRRWGTRRQSRRSTARGTMRRLRRAAMPRWRRLRRRRSRGRRKWSRWRGTGLRCSGRS